LTVTGIPTRYVQDLWPYIEPLLARSLAYAKDGTTALDILKAVYAHTAQLWAVLGDNGLPVAALATRVQGTRCLIWQCAGSACGSGCRTCTADHGTVGQDGRLHHD
jgi:hypothetical protein